MLPGLAALPDEGLLLLRCRRRWLLCARGGGMAASKRGEVFRKKVLEKLYPASSLPPRSSSLSDPPVSSKAERSLILENPALGQEEPEMLRSLQGNSNKPGKLRPDPLPGKMYTVSAAPEDYEPTTFIETGHENADCEKAHSDADTSEENDPEKPQRKRVRRKKQKNVWQKQDDEHGGQEECRNQEKLMEDSFQLQYGDGTKLSRNKKRKMKKKRQKERMRAAGLLTKPTGIDFIYNPEKEGGADFEAVHEKVDDVLDFLQATQEIYFSEKHQDVQNHLCIHKAFKRFYRTLNLAAFLRQTLRYCTG